MTSSKRKRNAFLSGYRDAQNRKPREHEPNGDPLSMEVVAYWEGWNAGIKDSVAHFFRKKNAAARGQRHERHYNDPDSCAIPSSTQ